MKHARKKGSVTQRRRQCGSRRQIRIQRLEKVVFTNIEESEGNKSFTVEDLKSYPKWSKPEHNPSFYKENNLEELPNLLKKILKQEKHQISLAEDEEILYKLEGIPKENIYEPIISKRCRSGFFAGRIRDLKVTAKGETDFDISTFCWSTDDKSYTETIQYRGRRRVLEGAKKLGWDEFIQVVNPKWVVVFHFSKNLTPCCGKVDVAFSGNCRKKRCCSNFWARKNQNRSERHLRKANVTEILSKSLYDLKLSGKPDKTRRSRKKFY